MPSTQICFVLLEKWNVSIVDEVRLEDNLLKAMGSLAHEGSSNWVRKEVRE
jgi:hypothetical protein